ncbi:biotin-dependent carboxyltransferase family protein [Alteromonadaceae bacterium BrNp21-10]|nr:biotin-dependent carboxyltransferase family protein [Alteromonadaceae bacterium BrNp21-10]
MDAGNNSTNKLTIVHAGMLSLVQDGGRFGYSSLGITEGGPLDRLSFMWANRLCGNDDNSPLIESTLGGLSFVCEQASCIAITGANVAVTIDDEPAPMWTTLSIKAGQVVKCSHTQQGLRCYIAIAGGLFVTPQFGSVATVVREGLGGINGKALVAKQKIACGDNQVPKLMLPYAYRSKFKQTVCLRVVIGSQHKLFSRAYKRAFFANEFKVSQQCDRMGYRLIATDDTFAKHSASLSSQSLLSEGIALGALQIPADGQPIVMMNDHQTIGGYPKMGAVLSLDLAELAQCAAGTLVRFQPIGANTARGLLLQAQQKLQTTALYSVG